MRRKKLIIRYSDNEIKDKSHFIHNFDVSVVMPFYKKMDDFKKVLARNYPYFQRNGVEVVIAMDEDSEENALIHFIQEYPFINWVIVVNHAKHGWRNPVKAINVGIRNATKEFILICSPESEFLTDVIYLMRKNLNYYTDHYAIGTVTFTDFEKKYVGNRFIPYGSIMVKRKDLLEIGGYDETFIKWGGDDDNIRARLELNGIKRLLLPEARLMHRENKKDLEKRNNKRSLLSVEMSKRVFLPNKAYINTSEWGHDFSDISYSWKKEKPNRITILSEYLSQFKQYDLFVDTTQKIFNRILLVQSYNEEKLIQAFLENNLQYFDAMILLDDDSTDHTYHITNHPKIILKVKKKRDYFNDLENRNILLKLVSFFNCNWICFLDVDEIIDKRFSDFSFTDSNKIDNILFNHVHLWNSEEYYNAEYPYSKNGIQQHFRMFRNIGNMQILTHKSVLHFSLSPYLKSLYISKILILHYGNITIDRRLKKYALYTKQDQDQDQISYEHIIKDVVALKRVDDILL